MKVHVAQHSLLLSPAPHTHWFQGNIKTVTSENIYNLSREKTREHAALYPSGKYEFQSPMDVNVTCFLFCERGCYADKFIGVKKPNYLEATGIKNLSASSKYSYRHGLIFNIGDMSLNRVTAFYVKEKEHDNTIRCLRGSLGWWC